MPITILDLVLLGVMLISGLLAMVRGFMREILSIAAWGAAALVTLQQCLLAPKFLQDLLKESSKAMKAEPDPEAKKPVELSEAQERIEQLKAQLAGACDDNAA